MRLTILTQYYPPETGAPQQRWGDLARRLVGRGHRVQVVTAMPNYPSGVVDPPWRGRLVGREVRDGVEVLRSWISVSPRRGTVGQVATYASFVASAAATAPVRAGPADVVMWESPPLFLAPVAWLLARRLGARLVMNVSDLWPASAVDLGVLRDPRLVRLFEGWERLAYRSADLVTHQTEGIGDGVAARAPGTPRHLFPNGVDVEVFRRVESPTRLRVELGLTGAHGAGGAVVGYAGNFGRAQALEQVVDAAALLPQAMFVLVGDGPRRDAVAEHARSRGVANVRLVRPLPAAQMPEVLSLFDAAIVPLADRPVFDGARPSKLFELLAVGTPVVYCGRGEGARLVADSGGGLVVAPERPPELASALAEVLGWSAQRRAGAGDAARRFVEAHFDRAVSAIDLERRLLELIAPQP